MARFSGFLIVGVLLFGLVPSAVAAAPARVDPSTLTPPPNPNLRMEPCTSTGQRITCNGVEALSAVDASDPAFSCGGTALILGDVRAGREIRFGTHDATGRVIRTHHLASGRSTSGGAWKARPVRF